MVDFEWFRSFIAVYRTGTVTAAALARCLTQPAISQHLSALETAVGHNLFARTPRKMIPTEHGHSLYSQVAPAVDSLEKSSVHLRDDAKAEVPTLRLGAPFDYFQSVAMAKLRSASLRLQIRFGDTEILMNELHQEKLDAVIATQPLRPENTDHIPIDTEVFYLVSSPCVRFPENFNVGRAPLEEIEQFLLKQVWIGYSTELPIIRRFWRIVFKRRPVIETPLIVPCLQSIRQAVEWNWGVSILPSYICRDAINNGTLAILWNPKETITNDLWIAIRKIDRNKASIATLISTFTAD